MKGQRGKQTAITRKQQRELKYRSRSIYFFRIYDMDTGLCLDHRSFAAFNSEEAFLNADAWAGRNFRNQDTHCEEVDLYAS